MKKYVKAAVADISLPKKRGGIGEDLCKDLGFEEYNGIWAARDGGGDILIYNPSWYESWILISDFKHDFKQNTYENLLDAFRNPDADASDIENQFNCTLACGPFASDVMIIS